MCTIGQTPLPILPEKHDVNSPQMASCKNQIKEVDRCWYIPLGRKTLGNEYCEWCVQYCNSCTEYTEKWDGTVTRELKCHCECNVNKDIAITKQDFTVAIASSRGRPVTRFSKPPLSMVDESKFILAYSTGLLYVDMNTNSNYEVHIFDKKGFEEKNMVFKIESATIGEKKIKIDSDFLCFRRSFLIREMDTFFSFTDKEKEERKLQWKSSDNIIRLKLQRYLKNNSEYIPVGETVDIIIQLLCSQTNEQKELTNGYYWKSQRIEERNQLLREKNNSLKYAEQCKTLVEEKKQKMKEINEQIRKLHVQLAELQLEINGCEGIIELIPKANSLIDVQLIQYADLIAGEKIDNYN
jgi:hypothetical protein